MRHTVLYWDGNLAIKCIFVTFIKYMGKMTPLLVCLAILQVVPVSLSFNPLNRTTFTQVLAGPLITPFTAPSTFSAKLHPAVIPSTFSGDKVSPLVPSSFKSPNFSASGQQIDQFRSKIILNFKRRDNSTDNSTNAETVEAVEEVECSKTMFMGPYHHNVEFSQDSSIYSRIDKSCRWNFIGTEPCIPKISCDTRNIVRDCDEEFLEISDGLNGYEKICNGHGRIQSVTASKGLRDLYVRFKVLQESSEKIGTIFNCTVKCGKRGEGRQLKQGFTPKLNPKCFCGTKPNEDRIIGGETARKFEFPWLVALVQTNTRQPFCGGSIINNRFVLTAAHCIRGRFLDYRNIQVIVNGHQLDSSPNQIASSGYSTVQPKTYSPQELERVDAQNGSKRYSIDEIIVHPLYVLETNDYDMALLKLRQDIPLTFKTLSGGAEEGQHARAVCLPDPGNYERTYSNKKGVVAGWGLTNKTAEGTSPFLQKLGVKVFSPQACKEMFAHRINRRMICAGYREGGKDSCTGDSGSALVVEDRPKVWTQIGVVSWGEGCGQKEHPGVYFRMTEGVQWVNHQANFNAGRDEDDDSRATWCLSPP